MDEKAKISVIIPLYNVEQYMDRCIQSIVDQTYRNLEIILVDDGSSDSSGEKAGKWKTRDSRIIVFHKQNGGLSDARNYGIEKCTGDYILFADSDDWLPLDAIEYLYGILIKYDADFSIGGHMNSDTNDQPESYNERYLSQDEFLDLFFKVNTQITVQHAWGKLYKRSLFESVRYPIGMIDEDVPTIFKIAIRLKRVAFSEKNVYFYFVNNESITGSPFNKKDFDLLKAWDLVIKEADDQNCSEKIKRLAHINRKRADFGILVDLSLSGSFFENKKKYKVEIREIEKNLRSNIGILLHAPIPKSRKLMILAYACSFNATGWLVYFAGKLTHRGVPR